MIPVHVQTMETVHSGLKKKNTLNIENGLVIPEFVLTTALMFSRNLVHVYRCLFIIATKSS